MGSPDNTENPNRPRSFFEAGKVPFDAHLVSLRRNVALMGSIDAGSIQNILQHVHTPWSVRVLASYHPERISEDFKAEREAYLNREVSIPSRINLCAREITSLSIRKKGFAMAAYNQGNYVSMIVHYDVADGIEEAVSGIFAAEGEMAARGDEEAKEAVSRSEELYDPASNAEYAQGYLIARALYAEAAELLKKDPTGYLLIEERVRQIHEDAISPEDAREKGQGGWIYPWQVSQFVAAGAEFGEKLYKRLYPYSG